MLKKGVAVVGLLLSVLVDRLILRVGVRVWY